MLPRTLGYAAYCAALALLNQAVLRKLADHAWTEVTASHVLLVPAISLGLGVLHRDRIFRSVTTASRTGVVCLVLAGCAWMAAAPSRVTLEDKTSLSIAVGAVVALAVGGFMFVYGWKAARAAAFPLGFLVLTVPIPAIVLGPLIEVLRRGSTEVVEWLFIVSATAYVRNGFEFDLPGLSIQIADACSGVRSSIALVMVGMLAGHLFLRTAWKKIAFVAVMLPLAIVKNSVRIVVLALLSVHVDRGYLAGQLHREGGVVFLLLAFALALPLFWHLEHSEIRVRPTS